ncbi:prepilin-type N-terminal cleavage/methylation domain-containing protein [Archangium violaceum]|uniref:prepilin-type N-terminal cleavage/methylation domain-containing protein n=1 Tax=Archangium violaceum TaxID=83451 RepID=UPI0019502700|nr:prepilin-type N-terminal cleavage/methylation domain-containing protein [Archangium violaceum]QRN94845.1 prepilin-type N-terminal cleavage/methylation domain-containing protein [Archangium violaceum]
MSYLANPAKREQRQGGFTLIEVMVVVAIIGVLSMLAMVAYDSVGRRGALQNAAFDLQGVLSTARTRASSAGYPVWVVFYPKGGRGTLSAGNGAFVVVEDRNSLYARNPVRLFSLPFKVDVKGNTGTVSAIYYLDDYSQSVRFGALTPGRTDLYGAPFTGLEVRTCSFCADTGSPSGAIGFYPDGSAHFADGLGRWISTNNQSLTFSGVEGQGQYLFAISGPSGYMATFSPDKT